MLCAVVHYAISVFVLCYFFSFVSNSEPIDLLNVAFEQQLNSITRYQDY